MKPYCLAILIAALLYASQNRASAQDSSNVYISKISSAYLGKISKKSDAVSEKIDAKMAKALQQSQKREQKIRHKLYKIDSVAANNIFTTSEQRYKKLEEKLNNPRGLTQFIPFLDTLRTSIKFLDKNKEMLTKAGDMQQRLDGAMNKVNGLENQLQKAEEVKQFLKQQNQFLKEQLGKPGFARQLKKLNKDLYYYGQQLNEYREFIKDKSKIERKAIDILSRTKLFQDFMRKNSMLASLFRIPADDPDDPAYLQSLAGLQTRAQVNQFIQDQIGSGGPAAIQQIQNNVQQARGQLQQLKDKITQHGGGSSSDDIMPEGFKPSNQKTKSFLKRLELGINIQTLKAQNFFPATSDLGLSIGYKLNDKSVIGIGASYKLGLGRGWNNISLTQEGAGFRSYFDWKIPSPFGGSRKGAGSFWLSGGYEANYKTAFNKLVQLKDLNDWQQSGLIGLSKVVDVRSNFFKKTKLQLLWDFLSYQQVPKTQALLFRIGYGFK